MTIVSEESLRDMNEADPAHLFCRHNDQHILLISIQELYHGEITLRILGDIVHGVSFFVLGGVPQD